MFSEARLHLFIMFDTDTQKNLGKAKLLSTFWSHLAMKHNAEVLIDRDAQGEREAREHSLAPDQRIGPMVKE